MQDYTPLGSTATTTVKEGILNHEKNINALRSTYSGTAFPTKNLVAGLKCYRTDLGETYTYNGKTWDSTGYAKLIDTFAITGTGMKVTRENNIKDLNDIKCLSYPSWFCSTTKDAVEMANCPAKNAFFLFNLRSEKSSNSEILPNLTSKWYYMVQILIDIGGNTWVRNCFNGAKETFTFGTWKKIASASDLANYYTKAESDSAIERQLKNGFTTASLTVSGETSVPTPSTENNSKTIANTEFVHGVVNKLVNGAPTALDTLQELATALGNDPNFSTTILNKIGEKESKTDAQIEHEKLQNAIDACLESKANMGITPETNPQIIAIPLKKGMFPISGYPDGFTVADRKYPYSLVVNLQGNGGTLLSLYAQHKRRELYFRVGWPDERGWGSWVKLATEENMAALDAKIPTKTSQLTNDSNFATKDQLPTKTSQLTNDSNFATTNDVKEAESSMEAKIPTKTSQLTNDSDFANTAALEAEAKKWKDAYNNLRKRSVPAAFDDDELTVLMDTPIDRGEIILSQPYTDFDGLLIVYTYDSGERYVRDYISSAEITHRKEECIKIGGSKFALFNGNFYWSLKVNAQFSPTCFPEDSDNCRIQRIYGVKFKEIT